MLGETEIAMKIRTYELQAMVLVQDEAPQDLLLGIDCLGVAYVLAG